MAVNALPLPGCRVNKPRSGRRGRSRRTSPPHETGAPESWMLFESLRRVRSRLANERKIKPRAVLPDKALMQMVRVRPSDADSLALVYGFGRVKLERYGAAFLDAIREFERGSEQIRAA